MNINSNYLPNNETNRNDLKTKMTTTEVNWFLGHGETQAENNGGLSQLI